MLGRVALCCQGAWASRLWGPGSAPRLSPMWGPSPAAGVSEVVVCPLSRKCLPNACSVQGIVKC